MSEALLMKWYFYSDLEGERVWVSPIKPQRAIYTNGWFLIGEV